MWEGGFGLVDCCIQHFQENLKFIEYILTFWGKLAQ